LVTEGTCRFKGRRMKLVNISCLRFFKIVLSSYNAHPFDLWNSRTLFGVIGKARRFLLCEFFPGYLQRSLASRAGKCKQCGRCCRIVFECPQLKDNLCRIYYQGRSKVCRTFPIDPRDLKEVDGLCGYFFTMNTSIPVHRGGSK
jgi:uncharacterized protein (UPF0248 family)